ncbi:MAG: regulatory protein RecX [Granulosicoccaceae bacterium]
MKTDTVNDIVKEDTSDDKRQAYQTAIKLLTTREHSAFELTQKLKKRAYSRTIIENLLLDLQNKGYQSDARFAEQFTRQRYTKGYGPLSIRAKLYERGIDSGLAADALTELQVDWVEHAVEVIGQKFRSDVITSTEPKIESRIARFLHTRGFSSSVALRALKQSRRDQQRTTCSSVGQTSR